MITDVPKAKDFETQGFAYLNLACNAVFESLRAEKYLTAALGEGRELRDFRKSDRHSTATAMALAQQGIELLLKGRIAEVSPYLLVDFSKGEWRSKSEKHDISFADLRTVDAQDLIRSYNMAYKARLTEDFKRAFDNLRKMRNSVFHTVDKKLVLAGREVLSLIMNAVTLLLGETIWLRMRRDGLRSTAQMFGGDNEGLSALVYETSFVIDNFSRNEVFRYIGVDKQRRLYLCPFCSKAVWEDSEAPEVAFASLEPNAPDSTIVKCIVCARSTEVDRIDCPHSPCKGNVISRHDRACLTCGELIDDE